MMQKSAEVSPSVRTGVWLISTLVLFGISVAFTGLLFPSDPIELALVVGSLLFVVMGNLLLERYFTTPGEAFLNSLTALLLVLPLRALGPDAAWWTLVAFLSVTGASSLVVLLLQSGETRDQRPDWVKSLQGVLFRIAAKLGPARIVFSVVFVTLVVFFSASNEPLSLALVIFWGVQLAIWALGLPQWLSGRTRTAHSSHQLVGTVDRVDSPHLVRIRLASRERWNSEPDHPVRVTFSNGSARWAVRLFAEFRADGDWGTLLLGTPLPSNVQAGIPGCVDLLNPGSQIVPDRRAVIESLTPPGGAEILGVIRERSTSRDVRIEVLPGFTVSIGQVLCVRTEKGSIFYQVLDAETSEESFGTLQYGSHIASAVAIGALDGARFERVDAVPQIGLPVFSVAELAPSNADSREFVLGSIPGTGTNLTGDFVGQLESHTAILGTTGSGKTEFAFEMIRHAIANDVKVICIDLTSQYAPRLSDLARAELTISDAHTEALAKKFFEIDTGKFQGAEEKKDLQRFGVPLRAGVEASIRAFLADRTLNLGLIELKEISNTKATLWITEMFLSSLLSIAKNSPVPQKILVVVEEAHTVMPEASFLGLGDFDSKGTLAKVTQIALQGRKYGVGLLVLAQRTATVSKSVLTQCNTVISFSCIDDTSIGFLRNVYGSAIAETLPNLKKFRAVAHGPWVNSGMPVIFDVPFVQAKAEMKGWAAQASLSSVVSAGSFGAPRPAEADPWRDELAATEDGDDDYPF